MLALKVYISRKSAMMREIKYVQMFAHITAITIFILILQFV